MWICREMIHYFKMFISWEYMYIFEIEKTFLVFFVWREIVIIFHPIVWGLEFFWIQIYTRYAKCSIREEKERDVIVIFNVHMHHYKNIFQYKFLLFSFYIFTLWRRRRRREYYLCKSVSFLSRRILIIDFITIGIHICTTLATEHYSTVQLLLSRQAHNLVHVKFN